MLPKVQQFIRERQYLHNVSHATVSWHTHNLKWLPSESPTEDELKQVVLRMREKGLYVILIRVLKSLLVFAWMVLEGLQHADNWSKRVE